MIEIRKSYEQPDDLEAMNTLGYFLEVYGFLHNEYVQPSHNYIVAEFNNRGYQQVPDNLLSNLIDRLNNIRDIILQLSSSGQFRTRERAN